MKACTGKGGFSVRDHLHRPQHRRRAGHVGLHVHHAVGRLERQAAGVEGDGLAHQAERRALGVASVALRHVRELDQPRLLRRCPGDAEEHAHLQLLDLLPIAESTGSGPAALAIWRGLARRGCVGVIVPAGSLTRSRAQLVASATREPERRARRRSALSFFWPSGRHERHLVDPRRRSSRPCWWCASGRTGRRPARSPRRSRAPLLDLAHPGSATDHGLRLACGWRPSPRGRPPGAASPGLNLARAPRPTSITRAGADACPSSLSTYVCSALPLKPSCPAVFSSRPLSFLSALASSLGCLFFSETSLSKRQMTSTIGLGAR